MFEFVKGEKLFDWNANETPSDFSETSSPFMGSVVETETNMLEKYTGNSELVTAGSKMGRKCTISSEVQFSSPVPKNHFGPIPGIPVGTCWEKRMQVAASGVHRPPMAGIHGREHEGAYSIIFSGTYAEDQDFGEEFFYSGCGGGVTDPTKLISGHTGDQSLERHNRALAVSCNAPVNDQVGAIAEDWQAGKPIRVVRTHKLKKHSSYAPDEGNRYDGIYKVVKYFPTIGQCGLLVWRFLLRRDDPEPAPWTDEGKQAILEKNIQIIRAEERDYIKTVKKKANKNIVQQLFGKSPVKNKVYPFPDEETFEKIIRESLQSNSGIQHEETGSHPDCLPTTSKLKKSKVRMLLQKTKSKKFCTPNATKNRKAELKFKKKGTRSVKNHTYRFPNEENRQQNLSEYLNAEQKVHEIDYFVLPASDIKEENTQSEVIEIVPDIRFLSTSTMSDQQCKSASKSNIKVVTVISLNRETVAADCKTDRNKKINSKRIRSTNANETLETQIQIDLTTEEDEPYVVPERVEKFIDSDTLNKTIWDYCKKNFLKSEADFLDVVTRMFTCRYCSQLAANPVTTPCDHNVCLECISNQFLKKIFTCPDCRNNLGASFKIKENRNLANALENLFPGYNFRY